MIGSWKRKLRLGMVGGGEGSFIGAVHRTAAALDGQIELAAGCFSRDFENTRRTGARLYLDPGRCYRSYWEMAGAEAKLPPDRRIDLVSIVTPNDSHFDAARTFLESGFHVVCDKPMTRDLEEARRLTKIVDRSGLVFALTHNYTGYPAVRHARDLFASGSMGGVRKVVVEYLQDWLMEPLEEQGHRQAAWRVDPARAGAGGALGDIGTHAFNILEYVTGERVAELCADNSAFLPGRTLDEDSNVLVRLEGGGRGVITVSQIATGEENNLSVRIYASEGAVVWRQESPDSIELYRPGEPRRILRRGQGYMSEGSRDASRLPPGHPEAFVGAFANIYAGAAEAIRSHIDGAPMSPEEYGFVGVRDGLRGMAFIARAVESAREGSRWVRLSV